MTFIKRIKFIWGLSESKPPEDRAHEEVWKFSRLVGKAADIEAEWKRIQQDEFDAHFAMQVFHGQKDVEHAYKKGIADGVKWCVKHFS